MDILNKIQEVFFTYRYYLLTFFFGAITIRRLRQSKRKEEMKENAREVLKAKLEKTYYFKNVKNEKLILSCSLSDLRKHLIDGTFTSEDLVNVFGKRIIKIGRRLNLTTEEYIKEAFQQAREKDQERLIAIKNGTADQLPLLHGIPFSIKDPFHMKDSLSTIGCTFLCKERYDYDCPIVQIYKKAGAIIICKGNVSQGLISVHTSNHVFGTAKNPFNLKRSCGGSSGGDAGLVATKCVPLALASDLGGSIRIPAAFTGQFGFKPTPGRCSIQGCGDVIGPTAFDKIKASPGPIARSVDDLVIAFKVQMDPTAHILDPSISSTTFYEDSYQSAQSGRIRVGYLEELSAMPCSEEQKRAMRIARQTLELKGFEIVDINLNDIVKDIRRILLGLLVNHFMIPTLRIIEENNEELNDEYKFIWQYLQGSFFMRKWMHFKLYLSSRHTRSYQRLCDIQVHSKSRLDQLVTEMKQLSQQMKQIWDTHNIQAIICPNFIHSAFTDKLSGMMGSYLDYQQIWSLVQYPCGVVPVTEVQEESQEIYNDQYNDDITAIIKEDMKDSKGMPLSVQVVASRWEDETCLGIMKVLDDSIHYRKEFKDN